jgi:phospholipid/cholesterol/gamma-HCH transport system substrate-binding protein
VTTLTNLDANSPRRALRRLGVTTRITVVVAVVIAAISVFALDTRRDHTVTAYFSTSTGLYIGDDVKVLGVRVGQVTDIDPQGDRAKVTMKVHRSEKIPAEAKAAIVAPSLVSGRFVQLAPAWKAGPTLDDGAVIALGRTAVPVSFDEVKNELVDLSTALGPDGPSGSSKGALGEAITTLEGNLGEGNATRLKNSLSSMQAAAGSLSDSRGDLFQTLTNLNTFTRTLVTNDKEVAGFTNGLAQFSDVLSDNRTQLAAVIKDLRVALNDVSRVLSENRDTLSTSITSATVLAQTIASRSNALADILHSAPTAVIDLYNAIENGAVTGHIALGNLDSVSQLLCGAVLGVGGNTATCDDALGPLLGLLGVTGVPGTPGADRGTGQSTSTQSAPDQALVRDLQGGLGDLSTTLSGLLGGGAR